MIDHAAPPPPIPRAALLALVAWLLIGYAAIVPAGDEHANGQLALLRSIVQRGSPELGASAAALERPLRRETRVFAPHSPGLALLALPADLLVRRLPLVAGMAPEQQRAWLLALLVVGLPTALTAALLAIFLASRGVERRWALGLGGCYGAATIASAGASRLCGPQLGACLACWALLCCAAPRGATDGWPLRTGRALVAGGLLGWAIVIEPLCALLALVALLLLLVQVDNLSGLIIWGVALLLPLQLTFGYHRLCFGSPWPLARWQLPPGSLTAGEAGARWLLGTPAFGLLGICFLDRWQGALIGRLPDRWELACWGGLGLLLLISFAGWSGLDPWTTGDASLCLAAPLAIALLHPLRGSWRRVAWALIALSLATTAAAALDPALSPRGLLAALGHGDWPASRRPLLASQPAGAPIAFALGHALGLRGLLAALPQLLWWLLGAALLIRQAD